MLSWRKKSWPSSQNYLALFNGLLVRVDVAAIRATCANSGAGAPETGPGVVIINDNSMHKPWRMMALSCFQ